MYDKVSGSRKKNGGGFNKPPSGQRLTVANQAFFKSTPLDVKMFDVRTCITYLANLFSQDTKRSWPFYTKHTHTYAQTSTSVTSVAGIENGRTFMRPRRCFLHTHGCFCFQ